MRKNKEKLYASPRLKIQSKSPSGNHKLKISSPVHSPRSSLALKPKQQILNIRQKNKIVWIANSNIFSILQPLERFTTGKYSFRMSIGSEDNGKMIDIISSIDSFINTYINVKDHMKILCEKWFIISNAINSKQMEAQFNQLYSPIHFTFHNSISSICNELLSSGAVCTINEEPLKKVFDLSLAYSSEFLSVEQILVQNISMALQNCLYVINDSKQWMQFCCKAHSNIIPYFISNNDEIKENKIILSQKNPNFKKFYVIFQMQKNLTKMKGFEMHQQNFKSLLSGTKFTESLFNSASKNEIYLNKIVERYLVAQKKTCIFYENPSKSSLISIKQIRQKLNRKYYLLQQIFYKQETNSYKLKYNTKIKACNQFSISTTINLNDQVEKINQFIILREQLNTSFMGVLEKLKKIQVYHYFKHKSYLHCITSALQFVNIKINAIQNLQNLFETHKITIIYGHFSFNEMGLMKKFYNVFLVPLSKQSCLTAALQQIEQSKTFIEVVNKSYNQIYAQVSTPPVETIIHAIYEQQTDLPKILHGLSINENMLKTHFINNLQFAIDDFRQNSKHILIVPMEIFSQNIEIMIQNILWKCNTISVEIYLKYGQEFIVRDRAGGYKFMKSADLQIKINDYESLSKNRQQSQKRPQPTLHELQEINQIRVADNLDNLLADESVVQLYNEKNKNLVFQNVNKTNNMKGHQRQKQQGHKQKQQAHQQKQIKQQINSSNSFINLLTESVVNNTESKEQHKQKPSNNEYYSGGINGVGKFNAKLGILGQQTLNLIGEADNMVNYMQAPHKNKTNRSLSNKTSKINSFQNNQKMNKVYDQQKEDKKISVPKQRIKQKAAYIKQYNEIQHQPIQTPKQPSIPLEIQESNMKTIGPQFYKLYIFVHRSVPHYSLIRRSNKQYHILVYTRLQQILIFSKYLKEEQKIIVIGNQQSSKVYHQLFTKSGINPNKLSLIFSKDLSENFIRKQVDKILQEENIEKCSKVETSKKFQALIVYSGSNERVMKSIKIVKKVFGSQLKLMFIKQKQFEEIEESKYNFKIGTIIKVYKIGLQPRGDQIQLTSIRNLFVLAMHPDIKNFNFQLQNLEFGVESYVGRLVFGNFEKDYLTSGRSIKTVSSSLRKKMQSIKSESNIFSPKQSKLSFLRTDHSERRRSQSHRKSTISRSSTILFKSSTKIGVIVSLALKQFYPAKTYFTNEEQLYCEIFKVHSVSKLAIVIINEKQFDMFQIFQSRIFNKLAKQIIWVIQTNTEAKQFFVGNQVVYSTSQNLGEAVQCIVDEYDREINFDSLVIESNINEISSGKYGYQQVTQRALTIKVRQNIDEASIAKEVKKKNVLWLGLNKSKNHQKLSQNVQTFPSVEALKLFIAAIVGRFEGQSQIEPYQNYGSLVLAPKPYLQKIIKTCQVNNKREIIFEAYEHQNMSVICSYVFLRSLIITDDQSQMKSLQKLPFTLGLQKNDQRIGKKLISTLL